MDIVALWIGPAVMFVGGVGALLWLFWWVCELAWRRWRDVLNACDVAEAVSEWKKSHPEKLHRFNERN